MFTMLVLLRTGLSWFTFAFREGLVQLDWLLKTCMYLTFQTQNSLDGTGMSKTIVTWANRYVEMLATERYRCTMKLRVLAECASA